MVNGSMINVSTWNIEVKRQRRTRVPCWLALGVASNLPTECADNENTMVKAFVAQRFGHAVN